MIGLDLGRGGPTNIFSTQRDTIQYTETGLSNMKHALNKNNSMHYITIALNTTMKHTAMQYTTLHYITPSENTYGTVQDHTRVYQKSQHHTLQYNTAQCQP